MSSVTNLRTTVTVPRKGVCTDERLNAEHEQEDYAPSTSISPLRREEPAKFSDAHPPPLSPTEVPHGEFAGRRLALTAPPLCRGEGATPRQAGPLTFRYPHVCSRASILSN